MTQMPVELILTIAFRRAHERVGSIVLDLLWKTLWCAGMLTMFGLLSSWVFWQLGSVQIQAPQSALANPLAWIVVARELWQQYSGTFLWTTLVFIVWCV